MKNLKDNDRDPSTPSTTHVGTALRDDRASAPRKNRKTKIVVTIGPATKTEKAIKTLVEEGMDVARFNFSHGFYEEYARWTKLIRKWAKRLHRKVEILGDLQGPRLRIGALPKAGKHLLPRKKATVVFVGDAKEKVGRTEIPIIGCDDEYNKLKKGDPIMLDNGTIELKVVDITENRAACEVISGGIIFAYKGANLPTITLEDSFTEKDAKDLDFILEQKLDYIGLSFVSSEIDIEKIRRKVGGKAKLVAKIERQQAVDDVDDIIAEADAVMVARGDLGIEIPLQKVPLVQKTIIDKCRKAGKPSIVATQMLASMAYQPRPTRAEVSDVANAVLDGADMVMLSDETAMGKYPIETMQMMRSIVEEAERFGDTG